MSEQDRINLYTDGAYTLSGKTDIGEKMPHVMRDLLKRMPW